MDTETVCAQKNSKTRTGSKQDGSQWSMGRVFYSAQFNLG